jgi:hypothetical protein
MTRAGLRGAWIAGALASTLWLAAPPAVGADPCDQLRRIVESAPLKFGPLATSDYATLFESWRAGETLPGFDSCWVDDLSRAFWCLHRAPGVPEAGSVAAAMADRLDACWPGAPTRQEVETGDDGFMRLIQDWYPAPERRIRLVHRRPRSGPGLSAVFVYFY